VYTHRTTHSAKSELKKQNGSLFGKTEPKTTQIFFAKLN